MFENKSLAYLSSRGNMWITSSVIAVYWEPDEGGEELLYRGYAWSVPDPVNCLPVKDVSTEKFKFPDNHISEITKVIVGTRNETDKQNIRQNIERWVAMSLKED